MKLAVQHCVAVILALLSVAANAAPMSCADLESANADDLMRFGASQHPDFSFATDGSGCYPPKGTEFECDWETSLSTDQRLGFQHRLIKVNANHLGGSGAWDYLMVFACVGNSAKLVLGEQFLYGIRLNQVSDSTLTGIAGDWRKDDPNCCPSHQHHLTYVWDAEQSRYRKSSFSIPRLEE